jgi:hypothetical protein
MFHRDNARRIDWQQPLTVIASVSEAIQRRKQDW